jgi:hypothetical protein
MAVRWSPKPLVGVRFPPPEPLLNIIMDKLVVNFIGLDTAVGACNWRWISTQIALTNSIELVHSTDANTVWVTLEWAVANELKFNVKRIIISDLLNYDDCNNQDWVDVIKKCNQEVICLTNNKLLVDMLNCNVIMYDFLFNRTKLYYFDSEKTKSKSNELWYYSGLYKLNNLDDKNIKKHYVSPTRRMFDIREQFVDYLKDNYADKGFIGCLAKGLIIPGDSTDTCMGYAPLSSDIYNQTLCSIYTESTFSASSIFHATEKTFEPLLKGNYIIPYSNQYFVKNLKLTYGFKFPNNVDYSYDSEAVPLRRFNKFLTTIKQFCAMSIDELRTSYDKDIAEHNRQIFIDRPYDQSIRQLLN